MQSAGTAGGGAPVGDDVISGTSGEERMVTVSFATSEQREDSVNTVDVRASSSGSGSGLMSQSLCCRICLGLSEESLLSPCQCVGSLAFVHRSCLEKWLSSSGRDYCELCGHKYRVQRVPCYGLCASLRVWALHPSVREDLRYCDSMVILCFFAVTVIAWTCLRAGRVDSVDPAEAVFCCLALLSLAVALHVLGTLLAEWWLWWRSCSRAHLVAD
ncbi:E3 ubiquitin-protein ligase MARCHF3-like [Bacillus rossius redtenbacheri]|uniref:E3 ubiquitin-protein ligase MARCHF3-like n=1 Tax=Bacillus rossius redtenbacheri TaxID=93214 RepID=UPI002FDD46E6